MLLFFLSSLFAQESSCEEFEVLEDTAMLGALDSDQKECLERELNTLKDLTAKRKISKLLINNAQKSKNYSQWERYVRRHLEKYDRSDANMCMGFSVFLFKKKKYVDAIIWSDRALEQRQTFASGSDFKKKVYDLYKIRTMASNTIWQGAEQKLVTITEDNKRDRESKKAEKYKGKTKNFAREWLDYARASGQSTTAPMQICISAAKKDFCQ